MPSPFPIPDQTGKTFVITGANAGIGSVTALELAKAGGHIIMACRSMARAEPVAASIRKACGHDRVEVVALDLASLDSVRACADALLAREIPIHCLINNAGLAAIRGVTAEGFELAFGVNHLGHFLLTLRLFDRLRESAPARIVHVASRAHKRTNKLDFDKVQHHTGWPGFRAYAVSKLANVLFNRELARLIEGSGVNTYALHPGVVASEIWRPIPSPIRGLVTRGMITNEEGALTTLYCATHPDAAAQNGLYYDKCQPINTAPLGADMSLAAELWDRSISWTGATPPSF